jgi:predicted phosphodiesterase
LTDVLLWILSDLHVELTRGWDLPSGDARPRFDVRVVAGDLIPRAERGVKWLRERVTDRPIIYVVGNHEFYGADEFRTVEKAKAAAAGTSIHVLQCETVRIDDVTFAGATTWTDFYLFGDQPRAMTVAAERMNDFRKIRTARYERRFRPHHAYARHVAARLFLESEMRKPRSGKLVVVSHHAPHPGPTLEPSDPPKPDEILNAAYRSDLTALMRPTSDDDGRGTLKPADLWIYGHTHESEDTVIGATRVVSNAKGYGPWLPQQRAWDNPSFNPSFVIEI